MLWPKIEHPQDGLMLAASHAVGINAYIEIEVATWLAGFLLEYYPGAIGKRYGCSEDGLDASAVIEAVARRRGCLIKGRGGELDLEKASILFLADYRNAALGRISLETPESRAAMLAATPIQPAADGDPDD